MTQRNLLVTLYPIAAASRLTGISVHTLRMWERRYGLKPSQRSGTRRRLYDRHDIQKLILLKSLVDRGHAIGRIAGMSLEDLEKQLYEMGDISSRPSQDEPAIKVDVVLIGPSLCERVNREIAQFQDIHVVKKAPQLEGNEHLLKSEGLSVCVLERPTLHLETLRHIQAITSQVVMSHMVVVYNYATQSTLRRFREAGITLLRTPVSADEVRLACLASSLRTQTRRRASLARPHLPTDNEPVPQPRFSEEQLRMIESAQSPLECECPKHLVDLTRSLNAFELYSRQCESKDDDDAALHAFVADITGHARALIETALDRVVVAEKISVK